MPIRAQPASRPCGVLPPCRRCGIADQERMYALMALWFSRITELPVDSGYFYLCPRCYDACVAPHLGELLPRSMTRRGGGWLSSDGPAGD